jgi:lipoprotein-anchoring transpeptidase ErfK/SrfK
VERWLKVLAMAVAVGASGGVALADAPPDIELWLGEKVGRYGDFEFAILGGKPAFPTPTGAFQVEWKSRRWWSKQYNAPMPYSIFFHRGAAIHQGSLTRLSHGCVHVTEDAARRLFAAAREKQTRVFVYP